MFQIPGWLAEPASQPGRYLKHSKHLKHVKHLKHYKLGKKPAPSQLGNQQAFKTFKPLQTFVMI